jgi:hypothetical protein
MLKSVLENKEYQIEGGWNAPRDKIAAFPSVVKALLWNTTSSAGDWTGYFVQKINHNFYLIPFSQENNWPRGGFTLYTGNIIASWRGGMISYDDLIELCGNMETW